MENSQYLESDIPQWISTWAEFLVKQYLPTEKNHEKSRALIEQIFMSSSRGDSCITVGDLSLEQFAPLIAGTEHGQQQVAPLVLEQQDLYLYRYWSLEQRLAQQVLRLQQQQIQQVDPAPYQNLLQDPHQLKALQMVAAQALNIITGGPGTGKTYTLARIIAMLNDAIPGLRIAMAAPTGKAAQRMKEALQAALNDKYMQQMGFQLDTLKRQETLTIHRLLGLGHQHKPKYHLQKQLPYDVIVIDEASMLDLNLATLLFEAIPAQARLILLGDAQQLASVDVGAVLADLQAVKVLEQNRVNLVTSRRFQAGAKIGELARFIQQVDTTTVNVPEDDQQCRRHPLLQQFELAICPSAELQPISIQQEMADIVQLQYIVTHPDQTQYQQYYARLGHGFQDYFAALKTYMDNGYQEHDVAEVIRQFDHYRILTAVRHGPLGLQRLNQEMEQLLFNQFNKVKTGDWYIGRPVIMTYNDYQLGLSNGDIGVCFRHRSVPEQYEVYFPSLDRWFPASRLPKSMQTSFTLSIHKSQGSEFSHTAVVLDEAATRLLSQELIYTAITRAKKAVSLLVHPKAILQALQIRTSRKSGLARKIDCLKNNQNQVL